jgi:hypothetical protein
LTAGLPARRFKVDPEIVTKSGERWLEFSMWHGKEGLEMFVRAHPRVEEWARSLGDGTLEPVESYGRDWTPVKDQFTGATRPLEVYMISGNWVPEAGTSYDILSVARPIELSNVAKKSYVTNLAFLRLKGISDPTGLTFGVKTVINYPLMKQLKNRIGENFRQLCLDYIMPVRLVLTVSSQEIRG